MSDIQRAFQQVMWSDIVTIAVLALVVVRAVQAIRSYHYVRDVAGNPEVPISELERLVQRDRVIAWCSAVLVFIGTWSLLNFSWPEYVPGVPRPFGTLSIFLVVYVMTRGPIEDRKAWRHLRGET